MGWWLPRKLAAREQRLFAIVHAYGNTVGEMGMASDRQLKGVKLKAVLQKRQLDQALNAKEFAVAAGISYTAARQWFRIPGFPIVNRVVFWADFVQWRRAETAGSGSRQSFMHEAKQNENTSLSKSGMSLPARATRILHEAA